MATKHIVAACVLVRNDAGEILLVKTDRRGWEIPGGQVETGESLTQAALREVREESGIEAQIDSLGVINSNLTKVIVVFGFRGRYVSSDPMPQAGETSDVRWVSPEDAMMMIEHPVNLQRVRDLLAIDEQPIYRAYTLDPFTIIETHNDFA